jgi:hypothetical protein
MSFESVSFKYPCQICGKQDWCFRIDDESIHGCRRTSGGIHKVDKSGADYWLYFQEEGDEKCKKKK